MIVAKTPLANFIETARYHSNEDASSVELQACVDSSVTISVPIRKLKIIRSMLEISLLKRQVVHVVRISLQLERKLKAM